MLFRSANLVLQVDKSNTAQTWAGTTIGSNGLATAIPFAANATRITMAVYSPDAGIVVRLKAEDVANGAVPGSANLSAQTVFNPAGPKLDFFALTANASISDQGNTWQYVGNVVNAIQQIGTVAMYQVSPTDAQTLNIALYPTGIPAANVVAAAQSANAAIGIPTANISTTASFTTQ